MLAAPSQTSSFKVTGSLPEVLHWTIPSRPTTTAGLPTATASPPAEISNNCDSDGILFFDVAGFDGLLDAVGLLARANRNQCVVGARRHENDRHDRGRTGVTGRFVRETLAECLPHGRDDLTGVRVFQMVDGSVVFARGRRVRRRCFGVDAVGGAIVRSIAGVSESSAKRPHGREPGLRQTKRQCASKIPCGNRC